MRRIGKFCIDSDLVSDDIELLYEIFAQLKFVPVKVEHMFYNSTFEMIGYSPSFDEIHDDSEPPLYEVTIVDGLVSVQDDDHLDSLQLDRIIPDKFDFSDLDFNVPYTQYSPCPIDTAGAVTKWYTPKDVT